MPRHAQSVVVVFVTCPIGATAQRIAHSLVERRLAACVNLVSGLESVFWWQGKIDQCREVLLVIKTTVGTCERLKRAVIQLHPYECPEFIALPVVSGHLPYLRWVERSVSE